MDKYYRRGEIINDYSIIKIIGEGRYGIAYLAINDKEQKCVIKQLKKNMLKETRKKLFYEEQILQSLDNPSFPKFLGKFRDKYREGYLLEYIEGKVFEDLVVQDNCKFTRNDIYKIASQLLNLTEILHNKNIVHRDIRLPNVIVKKNMDLALIDFGLARYIDYNRYAPQLDFWYIGDFLIHLYYTMYNNSDDKDRPWYEELDINTEEKILLKKLMGIEKPYREIYEIQEQLQIIKDIRY